jgi:hypothetical protein
MIRELFGVNARRRRRKDLGWQSRISPEIKEKALKQKNRFANPNLKIIRLPIALSKRWEFSRCPCYYFAINHPRGQTKNMALRLIAASLFGVWLLLVIVGKGGFVHLLLLNSIGIAMVEAVGQYRRRMTA